MGGVDRLGLLEVEAGRVGADPGDVEGLDHLGHREDVAVLGDRPAQQRQVVGEALGQEAALAVDVEVGLRVPLGQLLVALAGDVGQVPEPRRARGDADVGQRGVERELPRGRGQQVLAAQHVGDAHQGVVHRVDERVQRRAVAPDQHEVGHRARRRSGPRRGRGRSRRGPRRASAAAAPAARPSSRKAAFCASVRNRSCVVVAELGVLPGGQPAGVDLLVGGEGLVGVPGGQQLRGDVAVDLVPLRLPVGPVRAADLGALVPVQAQPAQAVEQVPVGLLGVAGGVGVLDAEDERAAGVPGVRPVEQRRPHQPDVHHAGRRRAEPGAHGVERHRAPPAVETASAAATVLVSVPSPSMVHSTRCPGADRPDAGRRAGEDDVAGQQGHDLGDVGDQRRQPEDQLAGAALLARLAVDGAGDLQVGRVEAQAGQVGLDPRADRAEGVEALGAGPLPVALLHVPLGDVVADRVAEDAGQGLLRRSRCGRRGRR